MLLRKETRRINFGRNAKRHTPTLLQFVAFRRVYHELLEKEAALQNVEDPHMRAELESEFEEESASTKRCSLRCKWLLFQLVDMRAPHQEDFQYFTFWKAPDNIEIIFHPHVYSPRRTWSMGSLEQPESLLPPGYRRCFNDGVAGYPTWLVSTIRLLQMLILCSSFTVLATHPS
ncbi:hypothetical protein T12_1311 [Trichinella patagoniensis]|uniref:Uncharacterized protein n=1 Tax=Trichinella patagoniensis TaxID=990121 RepID=A0A0V0Z1S8_9BILA|nr:hypothetical protein T12_1311 [Trichinella patagoniensis]